MPRYRSSLRLIGALWLANASALRALPVWSSVSPASLLAADQADFKPGGSGWAIVAMLLATLSYGFAANLTRRLLGGVPALVSAAGSQIVAAIILLPFALWFWPSVQPGLHGVVGGDHSRVWAARRSPFCCSFA
jgi:drug/metabolite transporter (DMT)-like permease